MSVFNSGYIIYDARIGVIKSIYAAILSVCPHCDGVSFLCRCMFKIYFRFLSFFVGKKAKTCIKRQDNPLGTEKLLLTKMHFGSMIWMRDIGMLN